MTDRRSDRIIRLYAQGMSTREVAAQAAVVKSTVLRVLRDAGIEMRPRGGRHY
ncbi:helix-turn-helix domain-containing protein [Rathayibacter sp. AY1A3]|uniref:helix-turn-helix domain-containing protein n=1 Tax=Rathayibacter sp. AY1A3 TaxID=2080521 RepID=UPI0011B0B747